MPPKRRPTPRPRPPRPDPAEAQIARINELTRVGRTNWFALLAYLAFAFVTILGVEDADFFIDSRQTHLPLIGVEIPTFSFFIFAPALGAALYIYLHLHIRKLIDAIAEPPPVVDGMPLEEKLSSWLLNDVLLRWRGDGAATKRPLDWLAITATITLIWLAGPFVQFAFYWRSWPAHEEWVTLYLAVTAVLTLHAGLTSWTQAWRIQGRPTWSTGRTTARLVTVGVIAATVGGFGWVKTESGKVPSFAFMFISRSEPAWLQTLAPIRLTGTLGAQLPADERDPNIAQQNFRLSYCTRLAIPIEVCGPWRTVGQRTSVYQLQLRSDWCQARDLSEDCRRFFAKVNADFEREWKVFRASRIAELNKGVFRHLDLRFLDAQEVQLVGVDLSFAEMTAADLRSAQLERAILTGSDLAGANLSGAQLNGTRANAAVFRDANLRIAQLSGADLTGGKFDYANFEFAQLVSADLGSADFIGTSLRRTQLSGSSLEHANLTGIDLRGADLTRVNWTGAWGSGAAIHDAILSEAIGLTQSLLDGFVGDETTMLPASTPALRVASCWETAPEGLDHFLKGHKSRHIIFDGLVFDPSVLAPDEIMARWICSEDNPKRWFYGPTLDETPTPDQ